MPGGHSNNSSHEASLERCLQVLMTHNNYIIIIVFSLLTNSLFGQNTSPTKKELLNTFKQSIQQDKKNHSISNPWVICNKDSSFFKSETIQLINNENYYYHSNDCCHFIDWTFYKKDKFVQASVEICKEPTSASVTSANDNYRINLSNNGHDLLMTTTNPIQVTQNYKVVSIDKMIIGQDKTIIVTLLRLK